MKTAPPDRSVDAPAIAVGVFAVFLIIAGLIVLLVRGSNDLAVLSVFVGAVGIFLVRLMRVLRS